jgi:hypothetical protein
MRLSESSLRADISMDLLGVCSIWKVGGRASPFAWLGAVIHNHMEKKSRHWPSDPEEPAVIWFGDGFVMMESSAAKLVQRRRVRLDGGNSPPASRWWCQ